MSGTVTQQSTLGGLAQLLSALSPIFLGSGKTTGATSGTQAGSQTGTSTGTQAGTSTSTTISGAAPDILAALIQQMNAANTAATDPTKVQAIVDNIIHQSTLAFAPTIGEANASGIYNSSTLGLLAGEASARASAEASQTALNFQTSEQQIAGSIGANLLAATKTQSTTGGQQQQTTGATTAQTQQSTTGASSQQTAPALGSSGNTNMLLGLGGLLLPMAASKLGITGDDGLLTQLKNNIFGSSDPSLTSDANTLAVGQGGFTDAGSFDNGAGASVIGGIGGNSPFFQAPSVIADPAVATTAPGLLDASTTTPVVNIPASLQGPLPGAGAPTSIANFATTAEPIAGIGSAVDTSGILAGTGNSAASILDASATSSFNPVTGLTEPLTDPATGELLSDFGTQAAGSAAGSLGSIFDSAGNFLTTPVSLSNTFDAAGNLLGGDFSGANFGNLAGGIASAGAGFAGNLLGGFVDPGAKGTGASIGSTVGGIGGSIFGPIGTAVGSFLGHIVGGLFGPNPPSTYSSTGLIRNSDGTISLGQSVGQNVDTNPARQVYQKQIDALNNFLTSAGIQVANSYSSSKDSLGQLNRLSVASGNGGIQLGINTPGGFQDPTKFADLTAAFPTLRFSTDNPVLAGVVNGKTFQNPQDLATAVQNAISNPSAASTAAATSNAPAAASAATATTPQQAAGAVDIAQTIAQNPGYVDPNATATATQYYQTSSTDSGGGNA